MSGEENIAAMRRVYELLSSGDVDGLDEYIAPDVVDHNPEPDQGPGLQGIKDQFVQWKAAVPDFRITPEDILASGDTVVARGKVSGTDEGGMLPGAPPTGKSFSVDVIDIVRIVDGKAVERWGLVDGISMMQQLGAIPEMTESAG